MTRPGVLVLVAWLLVLALGLVGLHRTALAGRQLTFDTDARILHRVLSQKMAQHEAVLQAVDALERQGTDSRALGRFVSSLLTPYPQLVAVERCAGGRCEQLSGDAQGLPAVTGGSGARPEVRWPQTPGKVYALAQGHVRVWVDTSRLLSAEDRPTEPLTVELFRPGQVTPLLAVGAGAAGTGMARFSVSKNLGTTSQGFPIRLSRTVPWAAWPWGPALLWLLASGSLAGLVARLLQSRAAARQAVQDAEQAVLAERARAQGVVLAATEGIIALDGQYRVTLANPAARQVVGHPLPLGQDVREVVSLRSTLSQQPFQAGPFWGSREARDLPGGVALQRGNESILVEGSLAPLGGGGQGRVLLLREVGPLQRRMLAQLEDGERRIREHEDMLAHVTRVSTLGEMSAGLAHELNQPLTAIVSYGQAAARLLEGPEPDQPRARHALQAIVAQGQRAAGIIAHLRSLVRRAPAREQPVDLNQAVQNILTLSSGELEQAGVAVQVNLPREPALVKADPVHLEQIILNLLRNALDAVKDRPQREIMLSVQGKAKEWQLSVQDSGPGLSSEILARLFTPFSTTKADGLGLGLTLSQTLAQGMGGELGGGNAPGGGAAFHLSLPRLQLAVAHD